MILRTVGAYVDLRFLGLIGVSDISCIHKFHIHVHTWWWLPVLCQACSYLPTCRLSPPFGQYQFMLLGVRHL